MYIVPETRRLAIHCKQHYIKFAGPWPRACQITGLWKETIRKETSRFHHNITFFNGLRTYPFQEKGSETNPEMSPCCCFLLKQLFLVQTARTRGAETPKMPQLNGLGDAAERSAKEWTKRRLVLTLRAELLLEAAEALDNVQAVGTNVMQSLDHLLTLVATRQVRKVKFEQ